VPFQTAEDYRRQVAAELAAREGVEAPKAKRASKVEPVEVTEPDGTDEGE